nr:ribonuclease H-like domain-containing protein [Tanacetum cinerariifolium]
MSNTNNNMQTQTSNTLHNAIMEAGSKDRPPMLAPGSKNRPPMLNKENYVSWSSRLLRYAKSRPNGKLIHNSIINGPYVRRMIPEPGIWACNKGMSEAKKGKGCSLSQGKDAIVEEIDQNDDDNDLAKEHEVTNLQCDYLELLEKCEGLETELLKCKMMSKSFESVQKHSINLELELQQCKEKIKNDMFFKVNQTKDFCKKRKQYFEIQDLKAQLQDKGIVIRVIPTTSVSRPQLKSNPMGDKVMRNNSQGKKQEVEDQRRNVKLPKNKTSVTASNDSLNAKTLNVNFVSAMCDKCVD